MQKISERLSGRIRMVEIFFSQDTAIVRTAVQSPADV
jgi:hypothetical protein